MEQIIYISAVLLIIMWHATALSEMPFGSPILTIYPCSNTRDVVVWFEPGLPPKQRNQYYLYINALLPPKVSLVTKFNAGVDITLTVRTDNNTYSQLTLKEDINVTHKYTTKSPGLLGYGYKVKGTVPGKIPYLTSLIINGIEYCSQPNIIISEICIICQAEMEQHDRLNIILLNNEIVICFYYKGFLDAYASNNIDSETQLNCGRRKIQHTELIVSGSETKPGDWPWHVAIYRLDNSAIRYVCGGTLISMHFVLTVPLQLLAINNYAMRNLYNYELIFHGNAAAHCATIRGIPVLAEILSAVLGKYNLIGGDIGSEEREVHRIITHDKFTYRNLNNDIALLKLKTVVIFNDYIQPACLWYSKANDKLVSDQIFGTVVGWGFDNTNTLSRTIKQAQMPMVADDVCTRSNPKFYSSVLNGKRFCAGYQNGTSACNGDSGSAFQVFIPDSINNGIISDTGIWHVRGIVSLTVSRHDVAICDPTQYVVFTDIDKYLTWIQNNVADE